MLQVCVRGDGLRELYGDISIDSYVNAVGASVNGKIKVVYGTVFFFR